MAKRNATTELTDRNWDQEYEEEEAGEFSKANVDTLKTRQIIKAKRRNMGPGGGENKPAAFAGFGGFAFKPTQTSTPLLGFGGFKTESKISSDEKKPEQTKSESPNKRVKGESHGDKNGSASDSKEQSVYLSNLKALNQSVLNWLNQHVEKNPYCILSPIFKDYDDHLAELNRNKQKSESNGDSVGTGSMKIEESSKAMQESEPTPTPKPASMLNTGLTFGMGNMKANSITSATSKPAPFTGFGFGTTTAPAGSGFSFAVGAAVKAPEGASGTTEEEAYVPPVAESTDHKEEGSLYSKKCKLFYQKEGTWTERGVGYLHLKVNDDKGQMLIRADTTLGNIILNIRLSSGVTMSRQGKNNVSMMCVPNPTIPGTDEGKAIPLLIRVKTADDADELLEKMKEVQS